MDDRHLKPRYALEVAAVGNRRFASEKDEEPNDSASRMKEHAAKASQVVWTAIIAAMRSTLDERIELNATPALRLRNFFSAEKPRLAVLSGLAAGGDQIGAQTALAAAHENADVAVELEAVLPFAEEDYPGLSGKRRPEFRADEAETLARLAAQARQVVRLDGRYDDPDGRRCAYEQAREVLLQNADVLVAIYDPRRPGRRGGTLETVGLALAAGLPVIAVLTAEHEARIAIYTMPADRAATADDEWSRASSPADTPWQPRLRDCVRGLLSLPHQLPVPGEPSHERAKRLESLAVTVERLRLIYDEARPHAMCGHVVPRAIFGAAWQGVLRLAAAGSRLYDFQRYASPPDPARDPITVQPYAAYYARSSELSDAYMRTYRGAFVLSFALASLAVADAVMLMLISLLASGQPPLLVIGVLGALKIGILVVLLGLERSSRRGRYQELAVDFRYLAELLRPMQWLARVGTAVPFVGLPALAAPLDPRRSWTPWLFRAIVRSTPSVTLPAAEQGQSPPREVTLDGAAARVAVERADSEWLQGQRVYHWHNALLMHQVDDGLERLARALLWIVLGCAGLSLLLELLPSWLSDSTTARVDRWHRVAIVLGAGAGALPAFIAALGGILFQSEAKRLRLRSEAMYYGLSVRQTTLRAQLDTMFDPEGGDAWRAAQRLRALAAVMIEEAGDWKVLYQTHEVHAG